MRPWLQLGGCPANSSRCVSGSTSIPAKLNALRPTQDDRDIFKFIFFNLNVYISIKFSLKFVPKGPINNILISV